MNADRMNQHGIWSGNRPNPFLVLHLRVLPRSESPNQRRMRVLPRSESRRGRVRRKTSPAGWQNLSEKGVASLQGR